MFKLQLLGKEILHHWKSFPIAANDKKKEQPENVWEVFEGSFRKTTNFRSYREQTLNNFHQQKNESIDDPHTRLTVLSRQR